MNIETLSIRLRRFTPPFLRPLARTLRDIGKNISFVVARWLYRHVIVSIGASPEFFFFDWKLNGLPSRKAIMSRAMLPDFDRELDNEPSTFAWIDSIPAGSVMYDCGASTGVFSLYAARRGVKCFAFEPSVLNAAAIGLNLRANRADITSGEVTIMNMALGDKTGLVSLNMTEYSFGNHSNITGEARDRCSGEAFVPDRVHYVPLMPLDRLIEEFNLPRAAYCKIDVDGAEFSLLKGGESALKNQKLVSVLIEIADPEGRGREITEFMVRHGFRESARYMVGSCTTLFNIHFARAA